MTNQKTKKRIPFSILDFIIIATAIAIIIGIFARYDIVKKLFTKTTLSEAKLSFVCEKLTPEQAAAFKEGTKFRTESKSFGTLQNVLSQKALIYVENSDGALISYEDDTLVDISGTFKIKVIRSEDGYLLNGNEYIAAGSVFTVYSNGVRVDITVISIDDMN